MAGIVTVPNARITINLKMIFNSRISTNLVMIVAYARPPVLPGLETEQLLL
jgi:hypothetical protein